MGSDMLEYLFAYVVPYRQVFRNTLLTISTQVGYGYGLTQKILRYDMPRYLIYCQIPIYLVDLNAYIFQLSGLGKV